MGLLEALWFWSKETINRTTLIKKNVIHFKIGWFAMSVKFQQYFISCCNASFWHIISMKNGQMKLKLMIEKENVGWYVSFNRDKRNKIKGKKAQSKLMLKERAHGPTSMTYSHTWLVSRTQLMRSDGGHQNQLMVWSLVTLHHIWGRGAGIDLS
jgi:hypothetical protein